MFLAILEWVFVVVLIWFGLTQIVIPIFSRKQLFPLFRKPTQLGEQIMDLEKMEEVETLQDLVDEKQAALLKRRESKNS